MKKILEQFTIIEWIIVIVIIGITLLLIFAPREKPVVRDMVEHGGWTIGRHYSGGLAVMSSDTAQPGRLILNLDTAEYIWRSWYGLGHKHSYGELYLDHPDSFWGDSIRTLNGKWRKIKPRNCDPDSGLKDLGRKR